MGIVSYTVITDHFCNGKVRAAEATFLVADIDDEEPMLLSDLVAVATETESSDIYPHEEEA